MLECLVRNVGMVAVIVAGSSPAWWVNPSVAADRAASSSAEVWQRVATDGNSYQAIILPRIADDHAVTAHRHTIVVDTSASQVGEHRRHALRVVESLLATLPASDVVRLYAVDVNLVPLSAEYSGPQTPQTATALSALKQRVPLGATNLLGALETLHDELASHEHGNSVIYIGDGQSAAEVVNPQRVRSLVDRFHQREIPLNSYAVGPQWNLQLLGCLAVQTGGNVLYDSSSPEENYASEQGRKLAGVATAGVVYPTKVSTTATDLRLLPATALPMRSDRETIYLSSGVLSSDASLTVHLPSGTIRKWQLQDAVEPIQSAFLPAYTQQAALDGGLNNALAGLPMAALANDDFQSALMNMLNEGRLALARQNPQEAADIAERVRQFDSGLVEARILAAAAEQVQLKLVSQQVTDDAATSAPPAETPESASNPQLLDVYEQESRIRTQKLQLQVSRAIENARSSTDPDSTIDELKRELTTVRAAIDVNPEDRTKMLKQLEGELLAATSRRERLQQTRDRMQQRLAQEEAQSRLVEQMVLDEERLENLIDRVRALMEEGRHGDDAAFAEAQAVAQVAVDLKPSEGTASAARFDAVAAEQLVRAFRLRSRRSDMFLETLHQVELSHIPFPDEPPVRFPPAAVWNALSQRRKARYSSVDLKKNSPQEQRIAAALNDRTELTFTDTPLTDAIEFLRDYHEIPIWIDQVALQDDGIDASSTQINIDLSGVSLRSGLRLLLEPQGLTYIIEDEVMKITTLAIQQDTLTTRVYPVADLAVIIQSGGGGGGQGGFGGQGGGLGGGGFGGGLGGGGFGGQGGGFGGGFPSIAPEPVLPLNVTTTKKN